MNRRTCILRGAKLKKQIVILSLISGLIISLAVFQNCSEVHFEELDDLASVSLGTSQLVTYKFDPNRSEHRPKINLTTIIDNSQSMQLIQNQMGVAFENVADKLLGFSGQANIFTTAQEALSNKPSVITKTFLNYKDTNGVNQKVEYVSEEQISNLIPVGGHYSISKENLLPNPYHIEDKKLIFNSDMTSADFLGFKNNFNSSVRAIGVTGSNLEQPFCTLLRSLKNNAKSGEYQAFIIATNEDDQTAINSCIDSENSYYQKVLNQTIIGDQSEEVTCESGEDCNFSYSVNYNPRKKKKLKFVTKTYYEQAKFKFKKYDYTYKVKAQWNKFNSTAKYRLKRHSKSISFTKTVTQYIDGIPSDSLVPVSMGYTQSSPGFCEDTNLIDDKKTMDCDTDALTFANASSGGAIVVANTCKTTCSNSQSSEQTESVHHQIGQCSDVSLFAGSQNTCEPFETHLSDSFSDMIPESCSVSCNEDSDSRWRSLTYNSCDGVSVGDDCSDSDRNYMDNKESLITQDNVDSVQCSVQSCEPKGNTGNYYLTVAQSIYDSNDNIIYRWPGFESQGLDSSQPRGCSDQDKQIILDNWNGSKSLSDFATCEVLAKSSGASTQTHTASIDKDMNFHYFLPIDSQEQVSSAWMACTEQELDRIKLKDLSKYKKMEEGSCKYLVESVAPNSCTQAGISGESACQLDSSFTHSCDSAYNNYELNQSSCSHDSVGVKTEARPDIIKQSIDINTLSSEVLSHVQNLGEDPVVSSVQSALNQLNSGYFLASFINIPGDKGCAPGGINPYGVKHKVLIDSLGTNGQLFSNCLEDYSSALENVLDLIVRDVGRSYIIDYKPEEDKLYSVKFNYYDGSSKEIDSSNYTLSSSSIITFNSADLFENVKSIELEVIKPL